MMLNEFFIEPAERETTISKGDPLVDNFFEKIYNKYEENGKTNMTGYGQLDEPKRFSKEQAEEVFRNNLKLIKKTIKNKIAVYEPLDYKTAYEEFIEWIQGEEYKVIRELPGNCTFKAYFEDLIRKLLIEKTYFYFLFEDRDLVSRFVTKIAKEMSIPLKECPEIEIFVRGKLEHKDKPDRIKKSFKEGSKLKTYFYTMIFNAVVDYERKYNIKKIEPDESNDMDKFESPTPGPHTRLELKEIKERVKKLDYKEKIAYMMYYFEHITNLSAIARTLKTTRHKAKKTLEYAAKKVKKGEV